MRRAGLLVALIGSSLSVPAAADVFVLPLHARTAVSGPVVRVGDVVDLREVHARDANLAARVAALEVGVVRATGALPCVRAEAIQRVLSRAVPTVRVAETDRQRCVSIDVQRQRVDPLQLAEAVKDQWLRACGVVATDCQAKVEPDQVGLGGVRPPEGALSFRAILPHRLLSAPTEDSVAVDVLVDGRRVGGAHARVRWHARVKVWEVLEDVVAGATLRRAQVRVVDADSRQAVRDAVTYRRDERSLRSTRALAVGEFLALEPEWAIAEFGVGDAVPVLARVGPVSLVRTGQAAQPGRAGSQAFVRFADGAVVATHVTSTADRSPYGASLGPAAMNRALAEERESPPLLLEGGVP